MDKNRKIIFSRCELCGCYDRIESTAIVYVRKCGCNMQLCHFCLVKELK